MDVYSHFATNSELLQKEYRSIWEKISKVHSSLKLADHSEINAIRYPWSKNLFTKPEMYASRAWEYSFAIIASQVKSGDKCLDVGCGMSAFTVYLKNGVGANVIGTDPDFIKGEIKYKGHGVSREFLKKTKLKIVKAGMEKLPFKNNFFDKVYCLSVIEHVSEDTAYIGIQEMARVLKPKGILILTIDTNLKSTLVNPLNLIWNSGLIPVGKIDVKWPKKRFGIFENGNEPADVYGIVLQKDNYTIQNNYSPTFKKKYETEAFRTPLVRFTPHNFLLGVKIIWRSLLNALNNLH